MALSTAAKAGIGGSLGTVAIGGPAATYYAWDYITLYEVEREVLEKDLKFTVTGPDNTPKKITLTAPTKSNNSVGLESGYSWTCVITKSDESNDVDSTIKTVLENHLLRTGSFSKEELKAKNDLVKACASSRDESTPSTDKKVVGTLKVKKEADQFVFVDHPNLNYLLKPTLYEVEEKVSELNVKLKNGTGSESGNPAILTVDTTTSAGDGFVVLGDGYSWSCKVTITPNPSEASETGLSTKLWGKLETNLPTSKDPSVNTNKKLENKAKLVKACSKNRETTNLSYKSVVGQLKVEAKGDSGNRQFSFVDHSELNSLLGS